jgi:hypothetical protein
MTPFSKMASQTNPETHERPEDVPNIPEVLEAEVRSNETTVVDETVKLIHCLE